jgi:hypothetical protein
VTAVNFSHYQFRRKKICSLIIEYIECDVVALQIDLLDAASEPAITMAGQIVRRDEREAYSSPQNPPSRGR